MGGHVAIPVRSGVGGRRGVGFTAIGQEGGILISFCWMDVCMYCDFLGFCAGRIKLAAFFSFFPLSGCRHLSALVAAFRHIVSAFFFSFLFFSFSFLFFFSFSGGAFTGIVIDCPQSSTSATMARRLRFVFSFFFFFFFFFFFSSILPFTLFFFYLSLFFLWSNGGRYAVGRYIHLSVS